MPQTLYDRLKEVLRPHIEADANVESIASTLQYRQQQLNESIDRDDPVAALADDVTATDFVELGVDEAAAETLRDELLAAFRAGRDGDLDTAVFGPPPVDHESSGSVRTMVASSSEDEWRAERERASEWTVSDAADTVEGGEEGDDGTVYPTVDAVDASEFGSEEPEPVTAKFSPDEAPGMADLATGLASEVSAGERDTVSELTNKIELKRLHWEESGDPIEIGTELCQLAKIYGASLEELESALRSVEEDETG